MINASEDSHDVFAQAIHSSYLHAKELEAESAGQLSILMQNDLLKFIQNEFSFCQSSAANSSKEYFIHALGNFFQRTRLADKQLQWVELVNLIRLLDETIKHQPLGLKLFLVIRHKIMSTYKNIFPLRDELDAKLAEITERQQLLMADFQEIVGQITDLLYVPPDSLTVEDLLQLQPAFEILLQLGMLDKANVVRLIVVRHPGVQSLLHADRAVHATFYQQDSYYYVVSVKAYPALSDIMATMCESGLLHQRNLEILLQFYENSVARGLLNPEEGTYGLDNLQAQIRAWATQNYLTQDDAEFQDFVETQDKRKYQASELEEACIALASGKCLQNIFHQVLKALLDKACISLQQPLTIINVLSVEAPSPDEQAIASVLAWTLNGSNHSPKSCVNILETVRRNLDDMALLLMIWHELGIASSENFAVLFPHASNVKKIMDAFVILDEADIFAAPQAIVDAIMLTIDHVGDLLTDLKLLSPAHRTTRHYQAILNQHTPHAYALKNISLRQLTSACRKDYDAAGFFSYTNFLAKSEQYKTLPQACQHMKANPASRTAKNYVHLFVANLPDDDYKKFWQQYLQKYKFSFFQKSGLVKKLLAGEIQNMEDIEEHANKQGLLPNRTSKELRTLRR
jgi:hypothetical protein